jgi:acylphosphatase
MKRVRVVIRGRVQGVGYRMAAYQKALGLGLCGWVRNQRDGSVEAELHGDEPKVDAMIEWCRQGPPLARVNDVQTEDIQAATTYSDFRIH